MLVSNSLTHSLTDSLLFSNSKLAEVVTGVADVDDEARVGKSLLQFWELRIVHKAKLLFRL